MRSLLTFLIALAATAFVNVSAPAHAFGCKGWPQLTGGNGCNSSIASASLPTLTYIGSATPSYAAGVATAIGANIGIASADRLVVVVVGDLGKATGASVTIGGSPATVNALAIGANGPTALIASLLVPSGATADIVVTYAGYDNSNGGVFEVYTLKGLSSTAPVGSGTNYDVSANPLSTRLATSSGGVVIMGAVQYVKADSGYGSIACMPEIVATFARTELWDE
jgi:hypothetical protein